MREIKFRAWYPNNKEGKMIGWGDFDLQSYLTNSPGRVMQFTGLKDKNGKEIYEGDIFNCMYHRDGHTSHRYSVIFNEVYAAFELQRHGEPCPQIQVRQTVKDHSGWRGEIIGNIYENPDLIPSSPTTSSKAKTK